MSAGIATPPVEGRWGAALWGKDQSWGAAKNLAGVWGGNPLTYYVSDIAVPNLQFKRQPQAAFSTVVEQGAKRQPQASFVRKP